MPDRQGIDRDRLSRVVRAVVPAPDCNPLLTLIGSAPDIGRGDEAGLAAAARAGDVGARDILVLAGAPLVIAVALKYRRRLSSWSLPVADLVQDGMVALTRSAGAFDPGRGTWRTFAGTCAARYIRAWFRRRRDLNRMPGVVRVDLLAREDRAATVGPDPHPGPRESAGRSDAAGLVRAAVSGLRPRYRDLITLRFGLDGGDAEPIPAIAARWGVSRQAVYFKEAMALSQLSRTVPRSLGPGRPRGADSLPPIHREMLEAAEALESGGRPPSHGALAAATGRGITGVNISVAILKRMGLWPWKSGCPAARRREGRDIAVPVGPGG